MTDYIDIRHRLLEIEAEMLELEAKINSKNLSFSDIQLLDQAWDELDHEHYQLEQEQERRDKEMEELMTIAWEAEIEKERLAYAGEDSEERFDLADEV